MAEITEGLTINLLESYNSFLSLFPFSIQNFINLFLIALLVYVYVIFIWKFHKFISTKNIIELDFSRYKKSKDSFSSGITLGALYILEYIIIFPSIIFVWIITFTFFLVFLTENVEIGTLLIISATMVAAIRMITYTRGYGRTVASHLAELLPFTLLAILFLNPGFFSVERVLNQINLLAISFSQMITYAIFTITLEIVLRTFDLVGSLFRVEVEKENKKKNKIKEELSSSR